MRHRLRLQPLRKPHPRLTPPHPRPLQSRQRLPLPHRRLRSRRARRLRPRQSRHRRLLPRLRSRKPRHPEHRLPAQRQIRCAVKKGSVVGPAANMAPVAPVAVRMAQRPRKRRPRPVQRRWHHTRLRPPPRVVPLRQLARTESKQELRPLRPGARPRCRPVRRSLVMGRRRSPHRCHRRRRTRKR